MLKPFRIIARIRTLLPHAAALLLAAFAHAGEVQPLPATPPSPLDWLTGAKPTADLRARYEYAGQDGLDISHAGTLRSRLGVLSGTFAGVQGFAEYEGTVAADRDSYRAASVHGPASKTVIADPESYELNQLWLSFKDWLPASTVKAGRQEINLDNQRYVGSVTWRQNMQTFDSVTVTSKPMDELSLFYGYVNHVDRIFGSGVTNAVQTDFEGNTHLLHASYSGLPIGKLTGFAYFMDLGNKAGETNSNQSFGLSLAGPLFVKPLTYYAEYGYQTDAFDSPLDYGTNYAHLIATAKMDPVTLSAGYEYLGSDNNVGYNFPLGTNHKFNGFADVFLITPPSGLQDAYLKADTKLPMEVDFSVWYHKFLDADGSANFGNEVDFVVSKNLGNGFLVLGKYAYYWAEDAPFQDIQRFSVEVNYKF